MKQLERINASRASESAKMNPASSSRAQEEKEEAQTVAPKEKKPKNGHSIRVRNSGKVGALQNVHIKTVEILQKDGTGEIQRVLSCPKIHFPKDNSDNDPTEKRTVFEMDLGKCSFGMYSRHPNSLILKFYSLLPVRVTRTNNFFALKVHRIGC